MSMATVYLDNAAQFSVSNGQLLMSVRDKDLLQDFLQALAHLSLNGGSGSCQSLCHVSELGKMLQLHSMRKSGSR